MSLPVELRASAQEAVLDGLEEHSLVFMVAPTGLGKSRIVKHNPEWLRRVGRVVHVLPLRSLVEELAVDLSCSLGDGVVAFQAGIRGVYYRRSMDRVCSLVPLVEARDLDVVEVPRDPYMLHPYVVTTYDSYMLALLLAPVPEVSFASHGHPDLGLTALTTAVNFYDEVHLLAPDVESSEHSRMDAMGHAKPLGLLAAATTVLLLAGSRVAYLTATLHPSLLATMLSVLWDRSLLSTSLRPRLVVVQPKWVYHKYWERLRARVDTMFIDVAREASSTLEEYVSQLNTMVARGRPEEVLARVCRSNAPERLLVVLNTVGRAVSLYREARRLCRDGYGDNIFLLHGRMARLHRSHQLALIQQAMRSGKPVLVVSTQVIEAGVDFDANTLITDIAPPPSLIQRAGRVLRHSLEERGLIIVLVGGDAIESCSLVYGYDCYSLAQAVSRLVEECRGSVDWRYGIHPKEGEKCSVYRLFLAKNYTYEGMRDEVLDVAASILRYLVTETTLMMTGNRLSLRIRELEKLLGGSLLRASIRVPVLVEWVYEGERVEDVVEAPYWLARRLAEKGKLKGLVFEVGSERQILRADAKTITKLIEEMATQPLSSTRRLTLRVSETLKAWDREAPVRFLGFSAERGVYSSEYGLT